MAARAVFYQECPVCGRSLRINVQLFGRKVECVHCGGHFVAIDPAAKSPDSGSNTPLLREAATPTPLHLGSLPAVET